MNINRHLEDYLEVKRWDSLTKEEKESGNWVKVDEHFAEMTKDAREEAMREEIDKLNRSISHVKGKSDG